MADKCDMTVKCTNALCDGYMSYRDEIDPQVYNIPEEEDIAMDDIDPFMGWTVITRS